MLVKFAPDLAEDALLRMVDVARLQVRMAWC